MNAAISLKDSAVRLRAPEPEDLDLLFGMENDTSLWRVSCNTQPYSRHQLAIYIKESSHDYFSDRQIRFVIECLHDGKAAGCVDLVDIDPYNGRAQVGIALLEEYRGRGLSKSSLSVLTCYAKGVLHLHQLFAYIPMDNMESRNLFISMGFEKAGLLKDWLNDGDKYGDVLLVQKIL